MAKNPYIKTPFPDFKKAGDMSKKEAKKEIEELREAIEHHNYLYYIKNDPEISDSKYDELFRRLEKLEEEFPDLKSDVSPTQKVGAPPVDKLRKKKHSSLMLSLKSSEKEKDIKDFIENIQKKTDDKEAVFVLEPKFDGLSVEVVFKNGKFSYAATRGDGETGEDISENVKTIGSLPLRLSGKNFPEKLAVRGEIFMSREGFIDVNKKRIEKGKEPFANARNAAAGLVRQLDSKKVAGQPLGIYFYEIIDSSENGFKSHWKMLKEFPEWGLKISSDIKKCSGFDDAKKFYENLKKQRDGFDYEIDGMVIKLDDLELREVFGTRQRNPRWAFAWKFSPKKEVTLLREIIIQVGRTGILTPVALLDPVEIGGVTVSRATLHNENEVNEKDVRPGDKVRIIRAGDVIPEVAELAEKKKKREKPFKMPDKCPVCSTKVVQEGAYTICPAGLSCRAQLIGRIEHFASQSAMNIDELGRKTIEQLVQEEMVKELPDLYKLKAEKLKELDGYAEKLAQKLFDSIQNSKKTELHRFLYALGIRHVGEHVTRLLAGEFGTLEKIKNAGYDKLVSIDEIGPEIAESISHFFSTKENLKMLEKLLKSGIDIQEQSGSQKQLLLKGKTIVITGELESYTREEAKQKIESLGGRATSAISSNTDYLVVGEGPGSKLDDAKKEGTKIIEEEQFKELLKTGKLENR
ncbi:MAG: NAD-dependent DNA ligase LigA [Tangfeifania sp.]